MRKIKLYHWSRSISGGGRVWKNETKESRNYYFIVNGLTQIQKQPRRLRKMQKISLHTHDDDKDNHCQLQCQSATNSSCQSVRERGSKKDGKWTWAMLWQCIEFNKLVIGLKNVTIKKRDLSSIRHLLLQWTQFTHHLLTSRCIWTKSIPLQK